MALPTRPLGSSGLDITTVGFGAWAIGGGGWAFGWGPQDDADSLAAIRRALERGINWIDTAAVYGLGHSEELVGRLLRELKTHGQLPTRVHQVRPGVGRSRPHEGSAAGAASGIHPKGVRGVAAPARRGAHRSLSIPSARRGRDARRGLLARDG